LIDIKDLFVPVLKLEEKLFLILLYWLIFFLFLLIFNAFE
jgi:hypothetical protein